MYHHLILIILTCLLVGSESHSKFSKKIYPKTAFPSSGEIIVTDPQVVIDKDIEQFCNRRCYGSCEKCCGKNYEYLCEAVLENDSTEDYLTESKACYDLFGVLDFICTEATYKINVWGTATVFIPQQVTVVTTPETQTPTTPSPPTTTPTSPTMMENMNHHGRHGPSEGYTYGGFVDHYRNGDDEDNYNRNNNNYNGYNQRYWKKRSLSQTNRNTITEASGTTQAVCIAGPECIPVLSSHTKNRNNVLPDFVVYVSSNPSTAVEFVPSDEVGIPTTTTSSSSSSSSSGKHHNNNNNNNNYYE